MNVNLNVCIKFEQEFLLDDLNVGVYTELFTMELRLEPSRARSTFICSSTFWINLACDIQSLFAVLRAVNFSLSRSLASFCTTCSIIIHHRISISGV